MVTSIILGVALGIVLLSVIGIFLIKRFMRRMRRKASKFIDEFAINSNGDTISDFLKKTKQ